MDQDKILFNQRDACETIGISPYVFRTLCKMHGFPKHIQPKGEKIRYYSVDDLAQWMESIKKI